MSSKLVIIPTYNEKENIESISRAVMGLEKDFHLLVIDDGSPDGTAAIVKRLISTEFSTRIFILERAGKLGLGTAYIAGFKWALEKGYDYIFEMDADFSHNPNDLLNLFRACELQGADMAIGSRYVKGVNVVNWPMGRVIMSFYASKYVQWITGMPFKDTTAGFICWTNRVLNSMDFELIKFKGYAFQIEMKYYAYKLHFNIIEVPIIFTDRSEGTSKMSKGIFKEAVFGVIQMKFKGMFGRYVKKMA